MNTYTQDYFKKRERLRRIGEIDKANRASTTTSWYFLIWNFCVGTAESIQEGFRYIAKDQPIFDMLFPNHPGKQSLLSVIGYSTWSFLTKALSPIALGFSWVSTIGAFKTLFEKENRNALDYVAPLLSLGSSVAWTVLFAVGAAGVGSSIATAVVSMPYLIPAICGTFALYNVGKCVKNCYSAFKAWRADKVDECKAYLKNAGKQLIGGVVNTLGLVSSLFLGPMMKDACDKLLNPDTFMGARDAVVNCFSKASSLLYAFGATAAVGAVVNTTKMNKETVKVLRHPINSIKKAWYATKADPVSAIVSVLKAPIMVPVRIVSLVVTGPIQGVCKLIGAGVNWLFNRKKPSLSVNTSDRVEILQAQQQSQPLQSCEITPNRMLHPDLTDARIQQKLKEMNTKFPSKEHDPETIKAKKFHLEELSKFIKGQSKFRSIEEIEHHSRLISRNGLFKSTFGASEVHSLTENVKKIANTGPNIVRG